MQRQTVFVFEKIIKIIYDYDSHTRNENYGTSHSIRLMVKRYHCGNSNMRMIVYIRR